MEIIKGGNMERLWLHRVGDSASKWTTVTSWKEADKHMRGDKSIYVIRQGEKLEQKWIDEERGLTEK